MAGGVYFEDEHDDDVSAEALTQAEDKYDLRPLLRTANGEPRTANDAEVLITNSPRSLSCQIATGKAKAGTGKRKRGQVKSGRFAL